MKQLQISLLEEMKKDDLKELEKLFAKKTKRGKLSQRDFEKLIAENWQQTKAEITAEKIKQLYRLAQFLREQHNKALREEKVQELEVRHAIGLFTDLAYDLYEPWFSAALWDSLWVGIVVYHC